MSKGWIRREIEGFRSGWTGEGNSDGMRAANPPPAAPDGRRQGALPVTDIHPMSSRIARRLVWLATIALVYFSAAKVGLTMAFVAEQVSVIWPPTGIALSAILLLGNWAWPGIWLG